MPKPKALSGRVALVTGSAGGIGKAIAKKFADEGACVVINDNDAQRLEAASQEFEKQYGKDVFTGVKLDVTSADDIHASYHAAALAFGGVDILVNCAGLSISKPIEEHTEKDWDLLYDVLVKGQFLVTQAGVEVMRKQGMGGDVLNIVSKNALVSGPNNAGYGSAKAAQLHLSPAQCSRTGERSYPRKCGEPRCGYFRQQDLGRGLGRGAGKSIWREGGRTAGLLCQTHAAQRNHFTRRHCQRLLCLYRRHAQQIDRQCAQC